MDMDPDHGTTDSTTLLTALRAAAEPTRLRMLALCARGELTVTELVRILGQSQPRVSRHLKLLTDAGLLERFREGTWVFHRLVRDGPAAELAAHIADWLRSDGDPVLAEPFVRLAEIKRERAEAAAAYFRRNAADWDRLRSFCVDDSVVEGAILEMFGDADAGDLLDVGTGTARILELLAPRARRAEGVDLSREMLAVARANLDRAGLSDCVVRQGDMYALPYADACFDSVTVHQVLHFADEPARAIAEAGRVLRPGGRVLLVDFAPHEVELLRDQHNHRRLGFADAEVAAWFAAGGLAAASTRHLPGTPLTVGLWLAERRTTP